MVNTHYKFSEVHTLTSQVEPHDDKVTFRDVLSTESGGVGLIALKAGQLLSTHVAPFNVMIVVLEGEIEFTLLGESHTMHGDEFMLMGADVPHSVRAITDAKVMLIKLK